MLDDFLMANGITPSTEFVKHGVVRKLISVHAFLIFLLGGGHLQDSKVEIGKYKDAETFNKDLFFLREHVTNKLLQDIVKPSNSGPTNAEVHVSPHNESPLKSVSTQPTVAAPVSQEVRRGKKHPATPTKILIEKENARFKLIGDWAFGTSGKYKSSVSSRALLSRYQKQRDYFMQMSRIHGGGKENLHFGIGEVIV